MLFQCWPTDFDAGSTLKLHWVNASCLLEKRQIYYPNKHDTSIQCLLNVRPPSTTLTQHRPNIGQTLGICVLFAGTLGGGPRVVVSTAAFHARVRGSVPGLGGLKETKLFLPHPRVKVSIVGSLRDREVACSASNRQGSNFESCVWRTVSSQSSHHPQEVLLAQFSLYVHKGGLKPDSFHFFAGTLVRRSVVFLANGRVAQPIT